MQREAVRLTRKNDNVRPFETGGEVELEYLARRADTGAFSTVTPLPPTLLALKGPVLKLSLLVPE